LRYTSMNHQQPSDRSFGIVMAVFFSLIGLYPLLRGRAALLLPVFVSGIFLGLAFFAPGILSPFNKAWMKLAWLLQRIFNPLIMGFLFYAIFSPVALLMRLTGKTPDMSRKPRKDSSNHAPDSYWIRKPSSDHVADGMKNQF